MLNKIKICKGCNKGKTIANNHFQLCHLCNRNRLKEGKQAKQGTTPCRARKGLVKKYKPTGELILFKELHAKRGNNCELCGRYINGFSHWNYHHIKPKSTNPHLRLDPDNIIKICVFCHIKQHS